MKGNTKKLTMNLALVGLLGLLAFGIFGLPETQAKDAWDSEHAEEALLDSFANLRDMRMQADWAEMYKLVDPEQRKVVDLTHFMAFYGQNVLTVKEFELVGAEIDEEQRTAQTLTKTVAELNVAKLPIKFRQGFQTTSPEELTRTTEHTFTWVWSEGSWYFQMEPEIFRGLEVAGF